MRVSWDIMRDSLPIIIVNLKTYEQGYGADGFELCKIMEEIYKTFVASRPGPKSCVTWSRADKEDSSGMIKYKEGNLIISKR